MKRTDTQNRPDMRPVVRPRRPAINRPSVILNDPGQLGKYLYAVAWVAMNDNDGEPDRLSPKSLATYTTVILVADLFGKEPGEVAHDVVAARKRQDSPVNTPRSIRQARTFGPGHPTGGRITHS